MFEQLIAEWGYLAILLGTFFEGETVLILGGFAAHQGYLRLDLVMAAAFAGSMCGDQVWFWVGRRFGRGWLERHPGRAAPIERATRLLDRWGSGFVLSFRFLYGLRSISPVAIGLTSMSAARFTLLNLIAAAIWAVAVGALGYWCGDAIETILGRLALWEHRLLAALAIVAAVLALHRLVRWGLHRRQRAAPRLKGRSEGADPGQ